MSVGLPHHETGENRGPKGYDALGMTPQELEEDRKVVARRFAWAYFVIKALIVSLLLYFANKQWSVDRGAAYINLGLAFFFLGLAFFFTATTFYILQIGKRDGVRR